MGEGRSWWVVARFVITQKTINLLKDPLKGPLLNKGCFITGIIIISKNLTISTTSLVYKKFIRSSHPY